MVNHDQLAVWDTRKKFSCLCLRFLIKREVWSDNIVIVSIKIRIKIICKKLQVLIMSKNCYIRTLSQFFYKRIVKHLLINTQLVKKDEDTWFCNILLFCNIETLSLTRNQKVLVTKYSIGFLYCLLLNAALLKCPLYLFCSQRYSCLFPIALRTHI